MEPNTNSSPSQTDLSLYELMKVVLEDSKLEPEQKKKLIDELRKNNPTTAERWTYRWAIWILGAIILTSVICITVLAPDSGQIPDGLVAIGSAAVGGIAGLLSPRQSPNNKN